MKSAFLSALRARRVDPRGRRWLFVPYDQLSDAHRAARARGARIARDRRRRDAVEGRAAPLSQAEARDGPREPAPLRARTGGVAAWRAARRRDGQLRRGAGDGRERDGAAARDGAGRARAARRPRAARRARGDRGDSARRLADDGRAHFERRSQRARAWRMDAFYRVVRRRHRHPDGRTTKPRGGKFSFDAENREPWRGTSRRRRCRRASSPTRSRARSASSSRRASPRTPAELDLASLPATARRCRSAVALGASRVPAALRSVRRRDVARVRRTLFHTRIAAAAQPRRPAARRRASSATSRRPHCRLASAGGIHPAGSRLARVPCATSTRATDGFRELPDGTDPRSPARPTRAPRPTSSLPPGAPTRVLGRAVGPALPRRRGRRTSGARATAITSRD